MKNFNINVIEMFYPLRDLVLCTDLFVKLMQELAAERAKLIGAIEAICYSEYSMEGEEFDEFINKILSCDEGMAGMPR